MPQKDFLVQPDDASSIRTVMLTLTEDCNLHCRYCYEPTKARDRYMRLETAQEAITHFMEAEDEFKSIQFDFFGGEPMLAFGLIREVVDWFHSQSAWPKQHLFYIGTNGTILTKEMKTWLVKHKQCVQIGISLDGNKVAHDLNRSNSYDRVMQNLPFFLEHWPDSPVKMTISAETIPHVADSIIDLEEKGIPFTANVVFEDIWGNSEQKKALLEVYAQQLDQLVEYYHIRSHLYPAMIVDRKIGHATWPTDTRIAVKDCVRWCGAGHEMVMVDVDGNHYPCHRFSPWVTGRQAPSELINRQSNWKPNECAECRLIEICSVCAGFNWQENGNSGVRTVYHCESFKLEVLASAKLQALKLLQAQPNDLSELTSEEAYKIKRQLDAILDFASTGV